MDARAYLASLVGQVIPTMTGRPNRILRLSHDEVVVATARSPEGQPVRIEWIQTAMDRLEELGEIEINVRSVGYRSAFVGAVLLTLPGVEGALDPRRVRLADATSAGTAGSADPAHPTRSTPLHEPGRHLDAALEALDLAPAKVSPIACATLAYVDHPGLYSWWVDQVGAVELSEALETRVSPGRLYVGQAGATSWPSGKKRAATLRSRISLMHLGSSIAFSTLRLSLAACLRSILGLEVVGAKKISPASEAALTQWMEQHLELATFAYDDADALNALEQEVLAALDPPFNLRHLPATEVRRRLRRLRRSISAGPSHPGPLRA